MSGGIDIIGAAHATSQVTVDGYNVYRRGEYFHWEKPIANNLSAVYSLTTVTATSGGSSSNLTGYIFLPQSPENYAYDLDGNMLSDGRWMYSWNAENQLTQMESLSSAPTASKRKLEFEYDYQGRRISKKVYTHNGSSYVLQSTTKFLYDGWNLIAELDGSNNDLIRTYVWGLDLSGTMQEGGGVGGLLALRRHFSSYGVQFVACDGNGNVAGLVDAANGSVTAQFEYGPFGEAIRGSGPMSGMCPVRWSTKYTDDESDFVNYGHRFYNPSMGRWLNRDPLGDAAFLPEYAKEDPMRYEQAYAESLKPVYLFIGNNSINQFDRTGLDADVTWNPALSTCGQGQSIAFIQIGYGGRGPYREPFVDDGSKGFHARPTGCPEYPNFGRPGNFEDSPRGPTGSVKFIVCQICTEPCCASDLKKGEKASKIVKFVSCKTWKKGDEGSLGQPGAFRDGTPKELLLFRVTLTAKYPKWEECYKCKH